MRRWLAMAMGALAALALAAPARAQEAAWRAVWESERAAQRVSLEGTARTMVVMGGRELEAQAKVRAARGRVRYDYEHGRRRWSLVDDGERLIHLDPMAQRALIMPRLAFVVDRALAERNYAAEVVGEERVAGRPTRLLEVRPRGRGRGPAARRLWLDRETSFALKQERYNVDGRLTASTEYLSVTFGAPVAPETFQVPPGWETVGGDDEGRKMELAELSRVLGLPVRAPSYVPSGYQLVGAHLRRLGRHRFATAELRYTDGLRVMSVFEHEKWDWREEGPGRGRREGEGSRWGPPRRGEPGPARPGRGGLGPGPPGAPPRRAPGPGIGRPAGERMTLVDHVSERALRYLGEDRVVLVVGDLPAEELARVAESVE